MRSQLRLCVLMAVLLTAVTGRAQSIDYDPRRPNELSRCDEHRYRGRMEQARACYSRLLDAEGIVAAEAAWALGDLERANELFRDLVRQNSRAVLPRVRWGRLFLQTHQYAEAIELFREALKIVPEDVHGKLGLASAFADRFEGEARPLLDEALKQDEDLIEAHLLKTRMSLEEGQLEQARQSLERAEEIASDEDWPPLEVYSLRAALELTRDRDPQPWVERALAYNPRYGKVYEQLAHFEIMRRRYSEASALLKRAVEVDRQLWSAHAELGLNLLRLGHIDEARAHLTRAYSGDPYSPTLVNSLRLLDRIHEFDFSSTPLDVAGRTYDVRLRMHQREAPILKPYALDLLRRGIDAFTRRYSFELKEPLTVELYPDHDDFAVRVAALPGIGLLGVTFGYLIAMDSPSGRAPGEFHWGSTLWHELAHVFTLEATNHRVPRWLSEGISVFEEWRTGPTPGVTVPPDVIMALREGRFLPVSELDAGFIRPIYPGQVQVSYAQAGLVCLFIEQRWGFERLASLLRQFSRNPTTAEAIKATFELEPREFDEQFLTFARERYAGLLAGIEDWDRQYQAARQAMQSGEWNEVIERAQRAAQLYPEHLGPSSPNLMLATAYEKLGRRAEAIAALERYRQAGGWDPSAMRELARWLDESGRKREATALLESLNYADPLNVEQHATLGERLLNEARAEPALREFQALLALREHDPAEALYGLARALRLKGDLAASRRHVLDALAAAPHYRPAQQFLLEIVEERKRNE